MALLYEVAGEMGGRVRNGRVEKTLPGGVVLAVTNSVLELNTGVEGWVAGVNISVPGRFFLKLVEEGGADPLRVVSGRPAPPPFEGRYRMWGSPPARADEVVRRVQAPLDEVRPLAFGIGLAPIGIGGVDAQLSAVTATVASSTSPRRVARVASLVDEVARRLDPLAFAGPEERSQRLAQSLYTRLPWASPDAGHGRGALRARFVLEELGEKLSAEARVVLSRVHARLTFSGALPRGPGLRLRPRRGLGRLLALRRLRSRDPGVDRAVLARGDAGAARTHEIIAPGVAELIALEGGSLYNGKLDLEPDAMVVVSGEMSRGSVLPYLESLVWTWRAAVAARIGQEGSVPSVSWFG